MSYDAFPKAIVTMMREMTAYAAVVPLKRTIEAILNVFEVLLSPILLEILQSALNELKSFQAFLESLDSSSRKRMNASLRRISEAICGFAEVFESHCSKVRLKGVVLQISIDEQENLKQDSYSLIEKLKKMKEEYYQDLLQHEDKAVSSSSSRVVSGGNKSKMVGLSDVYSRLKEGLVYPQVKNLVISMFGMTGIGKTTLAKKIFEDLDLSEWFECRAWVQLGREYELEEMAHAVLAQVDPHAHKVLTGAGYEEMVQHLKESLKGKRYLIVLDDVWRKGEQNLARLFPDNENGSHVLLTTTNYFVAHQYTAPTHLLEMRLMNKEESWYLLRDKVFGEDSWCPPQLEKAGKKIAEECDGLPLTIVTVANLLSKAEKKPGSLMIEVAAQKKHLLFNEAYDEISKVLYPRYENLLSSFKLQFLYMGVFPKKYEIPLSKLVNLWIVEELIKPIRRRTLEDRATKILQCLCSNSLVMILQTSTSLFRNGKFLSVKTCVLHSVWWHFCQREARKKNFFHVLDSYEDGFGEAIKGQSRLSIHNNVLFGIKAVHNSIEENCESTAHSLLCFGPYHQYSVPICFGLRLLQKLDAVNIRFYEFPVEVLKLAELRYLALTCNRNIPPSISKLLELQFLIINRHLSITSHGSLSYLPMAIWDMKNLRLLQVTGWGLPDPDDTSLPNLLKISDVSNDSCTKSVLERIPELKKLGIRIELMPDVVQSLYCFDHIFLLNKLESLKCVVVNPRFKSEVVAPSVPLSKFPSNLKKLHLSGLGYPWEEMSKVASLPNLEVLKLRCSAFSGPKWEVEVNGFQKLYMLLIEDADLVELEGKPGSFIHLQFLGLKHCYKLKGVHLDNSAYLSKIELVDCNPLLLKQLKADSLKQPRHLKIISLHSSW